jgi:hypothetical protein
MDQEEVDEVQRLARNAVHYEDSETRTTIDEAGNKWRLLCAYIMHIAVIRVNKALEYERANPGVL